jgi:hypothetical protein
MSVRVPPFKEELFMSDRFIGVSLTILIIIALAGITSAAVAITSEAQRTRIAVPSGTKLEVMPLGCGFSIYEVTHGDKKRSFFGNGQTIQPLSP